MSMNNTLLVSNFTSEKRSADIEDLLGGYGFSARIAIVNISLETALSIKLIPINAPIISGEAGGHWLSINMPRTEVPIPSISSQMEWWNRLDESREQTSGSLEEQKLPGKAQ